MAKIKTIRFPVHGKEFAQLVEIEDSLESLQSEVNGYIEYVPISDTLAFIVNENGLSTCPPNRALYADDKMLEEGFCSQMDGRPMEKAGELYTLLFGSFLAVGHAYNPDDGLKLTNIRDEDIERVCDMVGAHGSAAAEGAKFIGR